MLASTAAISCHPSPSYTWTANLWSVLWLMRSFNSVISSLLMIHHSVAFCVFVPFSDFNFLTSLIGDFSVSFIDVLSFFFKRNTWAEAHLICSDAFVFFCPQSCVREVICCFNFCCSELNLSARDLGVIILWMPLCTVIARRRLSSVDTPWGNRFVFDLWFQFPFKLSLEVVYGWFCI